MNEQDKRSPEEDELTEDMVASIPACLQKELVVSGDGWPITNMIGNCWCGHSSVYHALTEDKPNCIECQCLDYVEDKWATL